MALAHILRRATTLIALLLTSPYAMAIDLTTLWDFRQPELSEQRFRAALANASGNDALILQTQIARTYGLRKDFAKTRELLQAVEPRMKAAGAEARTRFALELGRSYASATHPPETQTAETRALARQAYESALGVARSAKLDGLAIDAIHMLAFVDTAPADQLKWAQAALEVVEGSTQTGAKQWEPSIRNNLGMALHALGRYEEALAEFKRAVVLREQGKNAESVRVAHWMVAWTLRALKRNAEALTLQLRLERECDAAGEPDPYVFEELEILYKDQGDPARAAHYSARKKALSK